MTKLLLGLLTACIAFACSTLHLEKAARTPSATQDAISVLFVTDIHFDPLSDPSIVPRLVAAPARQWNDIFAEGASRSFPRYGKDTNYALFQSFLTAAKAAGTSAQLVILGGDFVAHNFRKRFQKITGSTSPTEYLQFFYKTEQYVAQELTQSFQGAQLIPVLGNNDAPCGDYMSRPQDPFFSAFAKNWESAVDPFGDAPDFRVEFPAGGYYSVVIRPGPERPPLRIVALNDDYWAANYKNECGSASDQPDTQELDWLDHILKSSHEPVWILSHSPAGVDLPDSLYFHPKLCSASPLSMLYREPDNSSFLGLIQRYQSKIRAMLAGHTHMGEFRLYDGNTPNSVGQLIGSAVSPVYGNNPAFQVLLIDSRTLTILNETTYALDLHPSPHDRGQSWQLNSDLVQDFHLEDASGRSLEGLARQIGIVGSDSFSLFSRRFMAGSKNPPFALKDQKAYNCSLENLTSDSFLGCECRARSQSPVSQGR